MVLTKTQHLNSINQLLLLSFKLVLDRVTVNHHSKYLCQRSFHLKVIVQTPRHTQSTHPSTGPLQWAATRQMPSSSSSTHWPFSRQNRSGQFLLGLPSTCSRREPFETSGTGFFTCCMPFLLLNQWCQSTEA